MVKPAQVEAPSDDKRWKIVVATMRRNGYRTDALIETLHAVQESFGYLEDEALAFVADSLSIAPSRVLGVATFYHFFQMKPAGDHICSVCTGTACYIKGAPEIIETVSQTYDVEVGGTTADGVLSLATVRCIGACGLAPAVVIDGAVAGNVQTDEIAARLDEVLQS
ncbi:MAG: bidirectional hydrogenase complex protein HoxE [Chloroflexi bacterium]|nr:bidirectional hydrogenase complex protein HoxE [Chloroflexota bacterium]